MYKYTPTNKLANSTDPLSVDQLLKLCPEDFKDSRFESLLNNLQAHILHHHKKKYALHCFITFHKANGQIDRNQAIKWLKSQKLTSALKQFSTYNQVDPVTCLYLSYAGYQFLNKEEKDIPRREIHDLKHLPFKRGLMAGTIFGDQFRRREKNYRKEVHALLLIASDDSELLIKRKREIKKAIEDEDNIGEVFFEEGMLYRNDTEEEEGISREWFGFRDGISNPRFFSSKHKNNNLSYDHPAPLNLALIRDNAGSVHPCGSFLAFLKIQQHVEAYEETVDRLAKKYFKVHKPSAVQMDYAGALLMGRHLDGTPLALSEKSIPDKGKRNHFNYRDDPEGLKCPWNAHIRKANPRNNDYLRIVRRSSLYENKKNKTRGLLFMSFQSDLEWQFEDILNRGIYGYSYNKVPTGQDALFSRERAYKGYARPYGNADEEVKFSRYLLKDLITFRGGWYFFAPSIPYFRELH